MKIHTVKIRNFRCFGETYDNWGLIFRPNTGLNLIVGSNGSGKTALLDAIDIVMNSDGRSNQSLISEYDFPYCDTMKTICIEITLTDLGQAIGEFESDIQWIDPKNGTPVEESQEELNEEKHIRVLIIRFEAFLDTEDGEIKWRWLLPKFSATDIEGPKELSRSQHRALGYFRVRPYVSGGSFTLGEYSALGRHLRKLNYKPGKLPANLRSLHQLPKCSLENPECENCPDKANCSPSEEEKGQPDNSDNNSIGLTIGRIVSKAKTILGVRNWNNMSASLGSRYSEFSSELSALTIGLRTNSNDNAKFIPFERLSTGEKYAFSFALACNQIPGELPPVILLEEPEIALHPTSIGTILWDLQAIPTGDVPQVIVSSHSESVLRCFELKDIFIMDSERQPTNFKTIVDSCKLFKVKESNIENLIIPGESSALFADKVLLVEGPQDALAIRYLNRLAANIAVEKKGQNSYSLLSKGWCIFSAGDAERACDYAKLLSALKKKVAVLFDGDDKGRNCAMQIKDLYPTFIYKSSKSKIPTLEDALLLGLPDELQVKVYTEYFNHSECLNCNEKDKKCWTRRGIKTCYFEDRDERKKHLQTLCLNVYSDRLLFPKAFENLFHYLDTTVTTGLYELSIDV